MFHTLRRLFSRSMVEPNIKELGYKLCRKYLGGEWRKITLTKFEMERVHGGLTNHLFVCSLPAEVQKAKPANINKVLLRIYGAFHSEMSENSIRMMEECIICGLLAEKNIGPDLYGIFPEGRLEQFIPDVRSLTSTEVQVPQILKQIAQHVAAFHKLTLPLAKEANWFFDSLAKFVKEVKVLKFTDPAKRKRWENILNRFDLDDGLRYARLIAENSNSPIVFCHNDVQPGNLLVKIGDSLDVAKVEVIDFEYSGYNYRGFDIGNHFCEWMNDYNYPHYPYFSGDMSKYPSHPQKVAVVGHYLQALKESEEVSNEEIEKVIKEADR